MIFMIPFAKNIRKQLFLIAILCFATPIWAATVDGFVTKVDSPTEFNIGTLHVVMDGNTVCETETLKSNVELENPESHILLANHYFALQNHPIQKSMSSASCNGLSLKVGSHVQMVGDAQYTKDNYSATQVILFAIHFRQSVENEVMHYRWDSGALLEEKPNIAPSAQGWIGTMWLNGYPMRVTPDTVILTAPSGTQMSYRLFNFLVGRPRMRAVIAPPPFPKISASLWQPNVWVTYIGAGPVNGRVLLYRVRLWPNQVDAKEKKFWSKLDPVIQAPDYQQHIPGNLKFPHVGYGKALQIFPDQKVQNFVSNLGMSLIPQYQKELPDSDASKIHFRFYVIKSVGTTFNKEMHRVNYFQGKVRSGCNETVITLPSGLIMIPDAALARIGNVAGLAAVLSVAITSVLQKDYYIALHSRPDSCGMFCLDDNYDIDSGGYDFALELCEHDLRIGIRQMYLAGYDIREAPFAWAVAQGKPVQNPVINSKHPDQEIPWYAAYAFNYISHYYQDVDYSKLKRGEREYQHFLQELYKADPSLPRPQTQLKPQASTRPQAAAQPAPQSSPAAPTASASPAASPVAPSSATPATTQAH